MISCYFILLIKIHKKQNGQLARPFIPQVLAVSFWRTPFTGHAAGSTINRLLTSEFSCPHPCPCAATFLAVIPAASGQHRGETWRPLPFSIGDQTHLISVLSLPSLTSSRISHFHHFFPNQTTSLFLPSFQCWFKSLLFQEAHPDRNALGQLRLVTCSPFNQASTKLPPQPLLPRKIGRIRLFPPNSQKYGIQAAVLVALGSVLSLDLLYNLTAPRPSKAIKWMTGEITPFPWWEICCWIQKNEIDTFHIYDLLN